jgi:ferredoxin
LKRYLIPILIIASVLLNAAVAGRHFQKFGTPASATGELAQYKDIWYLKTASGALVLHTFPADAFEKNKIKSQKAFTVDGFSLGNDFAVTGCKFADKALSFADPKSDSLWNNAQFNLAGESVYVVDPNTCIGCQLCVMNCPANAISMKGDKAWIDDTKCIRCGVCQSGNDDFPGCPTQAISKHTKK